MAAPFLRLSVRTADLFHNPICFLPTISRTIQKKASDFLDNVFTRHYSTSLMILVPERHRRRSLPLLFVSLAVSFLIVGNGMASGSSNACRMSQPAGQTGKRSPSHGCCCGENQHTRHAGSCVDLKAHCGSDSSGQAAVSTPGTEAGGGLSLEPALSHVSPEAFVARADAPSTAFRSQTVYLTNLRLLR